MVVHKAWRSKTELYIIPVSSVSRILPDVEGGNIPSEARAELSATQVARDLVKSRRGSRDHVIDDVHVAARP